MKCYVRCLLSFLVSGSRPASLGDECCRYYVHMERGTAATLFVLVARTVSGQLQQETRPAGHQRVGRSADKILG